MNRRCHCNVIQNGEDLNGITQRVGSEENPHQCGLKESRDDIPLLYPISFHHYFQLLSPQLVDYKQKGWFEPPETFQRRAPLEASWQIKTLSATATAALSHCPRSQNEYYYFDSSSPMEFSKPRERSLRVSCSWYPHSKVHKILACFWTRQEKNVKLCPK